MLKINTTYKTKLVKKILVKEFKNGYFLAEVNGKVIKYNTEGKVPG